MSPAAQLPLSFVFCSGPHECTFRVALSSSGRCSNTLAWVHPETGFPGDLKCSHVDNKAQPPQTLCVMGACGSLLGLPDKVTRRVGPAAMYCLPVESGGPRLRLWLSCFLLSFASRWYLLSVTWPLCFYVLKFILPGTEAKLDQDLQKPPFELLPSSKMELRGSYGLRSWVMLVASNI